MEESEEAFPVFAAGSGTFCLAARPPNLPGGGTLPGGQADQARPMLPLPEGAPLLQGVPRLLEQSHGEPGGQV